MSRVGLAPCRWPSATIACIACGPSLTAEDVARVHAARLPTIVINNAWQRAPWADVLYAADRDWWSWLADANIQDDQLPPLLYGMDALALEHRPSLVCLKRGADDGLCESPDSLASGGHSGYQAINLACHLIGWHGKVILLGYDMQPAADGAHHWHPDHPNARHPTYHTRLPAFATLAAAAARHPALTIINASRATAITDFPRIMLDQLL